MFGRPEIAGQIRLSIGSPHLWINNLDGHFDPTMYRFFRDFSQGLHGLLSLAGRGVIRIVCRLLAGGEDSGEATRWTVVRRSLPAVSLGMQVTSTLKNPLVRSMGPHRRDTPNTGSRCGPAPARVDLWMPTLRG